VAVPPDRALVVHRPAGRGLLCDRRPPAADNDAGTTVAGLPAVARHGLFVGLMGQDVDDTFAGGVLGGEGVHVVGFLRGLLRAPCLGRRGIL
jgi:hypothetical protein